jgi:cephalosporin hydroxylase
MATRPGRRPRPAPSRCPGAGPPRKRVSFLGVETVKCPLDLWDHQEHLHRTRPDVVVECGVHGGGTTLSLAGLRDLLGSGAVPACDLAPGPVHPRVRAHPRVTLFEGSSTHPAVPLTWAPAIRGEVQTLDSREKLA